MKRSAVGPAAEPAGRPETVEDAGQEPVLFVSYSRSDAQCVRDAERHLQNVAETCGLRLFLDEREIRPGDAWAPEIEAALKRARAAVVFLSNHYLDMRRYGVKELQAILARFRLGKLTPFFVPVDDLDPYLPKEYEELLHIQWALPKDQPIARLAGEERERAFRKLNEVIGERLKGGPDVIAGQPLTLQEFAKNEVRRTLDQKYEILDCLGAGTSSVVFRARDAGLGRNVALKVLIHARYEVDVASEFVRRARVAAALRHYNIVQVLTSQLQSLPYYLVMECIEGSALDDVLARGPLDATSALRCFDQLASAMTRIHERGLVHGAIRPSNILMDATESRGRAVLSVHWLRGVAGRSQRGLTLEELTYLTPEQYVGGPVDEKTDQYQLGQLLCELLTGEPPARVRVLADFEKKQQSFTSPLPAALADSEVGGRRGFLEALGRMLNRDPAGRWPGIEEARRAIRDAARVLTTPLASARASFDRCAAGTEFFPLIYRELFTLRPELKGLFHETDLERQYNRLNAALAMLFEACEGSAAARKSVEGYGRQHALMGVQPEYYDAFLQAIVRAARAADAGFWSPTLEEAWLASLSPGVEQMKQAGRAVR